ncbi:MaoC family dehydratase [Sphingomonas bacterium]|uniref:MaoC family dehydratase n=1 Tax=Sphingomonas bacterium TaxID=1895847 RepID=UPI00157750CC|nr:MaoC family dehydratase [Sphingomonas bacterium]
MIKKTIAAEKYRQLVGQQVGVSDWFLIDQERIDIFAKVTEDEQFIHVDPEAAARTPFGGTIAHGFLTLSLLSAMAESATPRLADAVMGMNYGFNKVRFLAPVRSGKRVRVVVKLESMEERAPQQWQIITANTIEIEGEDKPALIAEWLTLAFTSAPSN